MTDPHVRNGEVAADLFGADASASSTTNAAALNAAAALATSLGMGLDMRGLGNLRIGDTVLFGNCAVTGTGTTLIPDADLVSGVQFGNETTIYSKTAVDVTVTGKGRDVHPAGSSGIYYMNAARATFINLAASSFQWPFRIEPRDGCRVAYSQWINPLAYNGTRNWLINVVHSGYSAHNTVVGGRWQMNSSTPTDYHVWAVRGKATGDEGSINDWTWFHPSMESFPGAVGPMSAMNLGNVDKWHIINPRTEGGWATADISTNSGCTRVLIDLLYDDGDFKVSGLNTSVVIRRYNKIQTPGSAGAFNDILEYGPTWLRSKAIANTTTSAAANVYVDSSTGALARSTSSIRWKHDLAPISDEALDAFLKLEGKTYRSLIEGDDPDVRHVGFIAEEVDALGLHDLVAYDEYGEPENVNYARATAYLLELFKRRSIAP